MASDSVTTATTLVMTFTTAGAFRKARHQRRLKRAFGHTRDGRKRRVCVIPVFRRVLRAALRRGIRLAPVETRSIDEFHLEKLVRRPTLEARKQRYQRRAGGGYIDDLRPSNVRSGEIRAPSTTVWSWPRICLSIYQINSLNCGRSGVAFHVRAPRSVNRAGFFAPQYRSYRPASAC